MSDVWYQCDRCTACCKWPGDVRVEDDEIEKIAEYLGMETQVFIENYTRLQSQTSRENARRTCSGSHASRVKDPYDDPGVDALLLKSRRGEPDLAPCSSESDDDDSDEDKMDEAIEKFFS